MKNKNTGEIIYNHVKTLFPICRSLSGEGVRQTLRYIQNILPNLKIKEVSSGTKAFDWTVPEEWNIKDAWVKNSKGEKIIDFKINNLHLVGYSEPINKKIINLTELKKHLYTLPDQPNAIPYITSYYKRSWGFCINYKQYQDLVEDNYEVCIESSLTKGVLNYGELIIKGREEKEILLSTYVCHPSMGNNELSGPCVATALCEWLLSLNGDHKYTYRIVFVPETIGSIIYLSKHLGELKSRVIAGFVISCVGDDRDYSVISSPDENTLADRVANHILKHHYPQYSKYPFTERGSDERQYCSPGVDLPVVGISRTKYGMYPEYHTSLDNLDLISPLGLEGGYNVIKKIIQTLEMNEFYQNKVLCEPQLGKRGLYPTISTKESGKQVEDMMNFLAFANGKRDLIEIAEKTNTDIFKFFELIKKLQKAGLIQIRH